MRRWCCAGEGGNMGRSGMVLLDVGRERGERRVDAGDVKGEGLVEVRVSSSGRECDSRPFWTL